MSDAFFLPLGPDRWEATARTSGPWDPGFQHGGPPSALLARAVETCLPRPEMQVARITVEILGPVPVGELTVRAQVERPGRRVELVRAVLSAGGRDVAAAGAWRVARTSAPAVAPRSRPAPPLPDEQEPLTLGDWHDGYLSAVDWRFAQGRFDAPGPAVVWSRLRHPVVPDEEPTGLQRAVAVADSGNGLSSELEIARWHFINPELTVHLHREPVGEWVCVDAQTTISPGGVGLATTVLSDLDGAVGTGAQSLLVAPR